MTRERPRTIVIREGGDHGCLITVLLLIVAWPLAVVYVIARTVLWALRAAFDWLTLGPLRRLRS